MPACFGFAKCSLAKQFTKFSPEQLRLFWEPSRKTGVYGVYGSTNILEYQPCRACLQSGRKSADAVRFARGALDTVGRPESQLSNRSQRTSRFTARVRTASDVEEADR